MILRMTLPEIAILLPLLIMCLTVHEFAHGGVAYLLGDRTASEAGRLSLNPLRHIDIIGLVMVLVVGIGWAKPVPVDMRRMRSPRRDMVLVSLAGPVANLLLAMLFGVITRLFLLSGVYANAATRTIFSALITAVTINVMLFVFNMIPIPPLDGSKVVGMAIGRRFPAVMAAYFRYGAYALVVVLLLQMVLNVNIIPFAAINRAVMSVVLG